MIIFFYQYSQKYSMRNSKQVKILTSPQQPPPQSSPKIKPTFIANSYIQQLKQQFTTPDNILTHYDSLMNIFHKTNQHFLMDLSTKMTIDDFKVFLAHLVLIRKEMDEHIVEKSKRSCWQYILIQGVVSYNIKSQVQQEEMVQVGIGYPGFLIFPQIFMSPRYANYTIQCQSDCTFLALNEQVYNRYIKKLMVKQVDKLADFISNVSIFHGMGTLNIRKYLAYFIPKSYKYNEIIYTAGNDVNQVYFVVKGQVQIYSTQGQSQINVVSLTQGECFGLDGENQNINIRTFNAKSKNANLIVLVLNINIWRMMKCQNNKIVDNCSNYLKNIDKLHSSLIHKNIKVLTNKQQACRKIARKKKKKVKANQNSLAWWGLAENVKIQHKYQMPIPPQVKTGRRESNQEQECKTTLMGHKINQLRRRILQNEEIQTQNQQQNQEIESSPYKITGNYAPKVKTRVKMLQARPKVIDLAQVVKRKLITYAKNMGSFCDRLNLQ